MTSGPVSEKKNEIVELETSTQPQQSHNTLYEWGKLAITGAFRTTLLGISTIAGGTLETEVNHGGPCGCPGCTPPPRVELVKEKREDDGEGEGEE